MYIPLSDYKHQMVRDSSKNALASADVMVTQLLHYQMPLFYLVCNHLIYILQDLGLAQNAATQTASPTPLGSLAHQIYRIMCQTGYGLNDFSSAFKFLQEQEKK